MMSKPDPAQPRPRGTRGPRPGHGGRPKEEPKTNLFIRFPVRHEAHLAALCARYGSMSEAVTAAIIGFSPLKKP